MPGGDHELSRSGHHFCGLARIAREFSLGPTAKGLVLSSFFWSYTLLQVPVGVLIDRLNVRWLYAGAFALWSVACGLTGMVGGFATLIVMRIILGIGEAVMLPGSLRVVNIIFPPRDRGLPTGIVTSGTRLGLALGTPLVAWLTVRYGWRTMFAVVGFSALIWLLPWIMTFPGPSSARSEETTSQNDPAGKPRGWLFTIDRNLIGSCLGYFSFGYYQYMLMTWLPDYFVHVRHFQLLKAGVYAAASYLIWGFGQAAGGWLGDAMVGWGWSETTVRKGLISASYVSGLAADSRRAGQQSPGCHAVGCRVVAGRGVFLQHPRDHAELRSPWRGRELDWLRKLCGKPWRGTFTFRHRRAD